MAFTLCLVRNLPRALNNLPTKTYFAGPTIVRSVSALSSLQARESRFPQPSSVLYSTALRLAPACLSKAPLNINLTHVKEFSVSPRQMSAAGMDHGKLWTLERGVAASLLGLLPLAFVVPCKPLDTLLAISLVMHTHWGFEAIVVDYVRESLVGSIIPKVSIALVYALTIATLAGLFNLIYTGPGLANSILMLWKV